MDEILSLFSLLKLLPLQVSLNRTKLSRNFKKIWFRINLVYYLNNIEESELQLFPFPDLTQKMM
jgi:hypothetical protein